jgi:quinol monooxygenase YgiN
MSKICNAVSLRPYFKAHPGKWPEVKRLLDTFVEESATEEKSLYYEFTANGDELACREGYADADGLLAHLANVEGILAELLKITTLTRLEVHGPEEELEKLKGPLGELNPAWFVIQCGVKA